MFWNVNDMYLLILCHKKYICIRNCSENILDRCQPYIDHCRSAHIVAFRSIHHCEFHKISSFDLPFLWYKFLFKIFGTEIALKLKFTWIRAPYCTCIFHPMNCFSSVASAYFTLWITFHQWHLHISPYELLFICGICIFHHMNYFSSVASAYFTLWITFHLWHLHISPYELLFICGICIFHPMNYFSSVASTYFTLWITFHQ